MNNLNNKKQHYRLNSETISITMTCLKHGRPPLTKNPGSAPAFWGIGYIKHNANTTWMCREGES